MTASMDKEAPAMESMRWVGVDVHAKESLAAVLDPTTGEINTQRISGRPGEAVLEWLATLAPPLRAVYEAGPTGYGLVRRARERGLDVVVCAPGHILKNATDHIKVDKRDAVRLARLLSAGELRVVRVPEPDEEHLRDLVRSREDLRVDLTRIRNRIAPTLGHSGVRCASWSANLAVRRSCRLPPWRSGRTKRRHRHPHHQGARAGRRCSVCPCP